MASKGKHKSIYIPPDLAAKLDENSDKINFSRVCRTAVEAALDETAENGVSIGTVLKDLRQREDEIRKLKQMIQGLIRHAANYCDMTVLSEKDAKAYHEVFDKGVESFIFRIKQEALKESRVKKKRRRPIRKKKKENISSKVSRISFDKVPEYEHEEKGVAEYQNLETLPAVLHTGEARVETIDLPPSNNTTCPVCNRAYGDVPCEGGCEKMICWFCWSEMDEKSPGQLKLCPECNEKS